jgi:hypothetical protein
MNTQLISYDARRAIQVGYENHWRFRVVGQGQMPEEAYYSDEWVYEPAETPQMAHDRLDALKRSGIHMKGFVIAHEAPRLLATPTSKKHILKNNQDEAIVPDAGKILDSFVQGFLFFVAIVFQAALLDPALIVILEDGTWLEVMTWYE